MNTPEERQRAEEDASISVITAVGCLALDALIIGNAVSMEPLGWSAEAPAFVASGVFVTALTATAAYQWLKFHRLRDQLNA